MIQEAATEFLNVTGNLGFALSFGAIGITLKEVADRKAAEMPDDVEDLSGVKIPDWDWPSPETSECRIQRPFDWNHRVPCRQVGEGPAWPLMAR